MQYLSFCSWLISYAQLTFDVNRMPDLARSLMRIAAQLSPTIPQDVCRYEKLFMTCLTSPLLQMDAANAILFMIQALRMEPSKPEIDQAVGLMNLLPFDLCQPELSRMCFKAMRSLMKRNVFSFDIDKVFVLINSPMAKEALLTLCEATKLSRDAQIRTVQHVGDFCALFSNPALYPVFKYAAQVVYNAATCEGEVTNALVDLVPLMMNPDLQNQADYETKSLLIEATSVIIDKATSTMIANLPEIMDSLAEQLIIDDRNIRGAILTAIASTGYDSPFTRECLASVTEDEDDVASAQMAANILQVLEQREANGW